MSAPKTPANGGNTIIVEMSSAILMALHFFHLLTSGESYFHNTILLVRPTIECRISAVYTTFIGVFGYVI